jgi:hypothetical protein
MSTALKTPREREVKIAPAPVEAPAGPAPDAAPATAYRPDCWGFKFWLGCAVVLVLLHVLDWLYALLGR